MTDRIYENNSYIKEFRAQVVACLPAGEAFSGWQDGEKGAWAVVLDQTAFFPEGGGQSADTGRLFCGGFSEKTAFKVYDVQIKDGTVYHRTDSFCRKGNAGFRENRLGRAFFQYAATFWGAYFFRACTPAFWL